MSTAEDIKNKIWAMANELRGNMDASEYRDYFRVHVLSLLI